MAVQKTDFIPHNRGGTPGDGDTGTYYVSTVADLEAALTKLSADAGNVLVAGSDGGLHLTKATIEAQVDESTLVWNGSTHVLTHTGHNGTATAIDLSALTTDVYVNGGVINVAGQLVLSDNNGTTPDIVIDLSSYVNAVTDDQSAGTLTLGTAGGNTVIKKTSWMSAPAAP